MNLAKKSCPCENGGEVENGGVRARFGLHHSHLGLSSAFGIEQVEKIFDKFVSVSQEGGQESWKRGDCGLGLAMM